MMDMLFWIKASGAAIGSSIAIVFAPNKDNSYRIIQRFIIGIILGFIIAPVIITRLHLKHTWDYWLAASCLGGLFGYLILQILFRTRQRFSHIIRYKREH